MTSSFKQRRQDWVMGDLILVLASSIWIDRALGLYRSKGKRERKRENENNIWHWMDDGKDEVEGSIYKNKGSLSLSDR